MIDVIYVILWVILQTVCVGSNPHPLGVISGMLAAILATPILFLYLGGI